MPTKPTIDEWVIALARDLFVSRLANTLNPEPAKNAVTLAEDLTEELVKRGYTPYAVEADGNPARMAA